MDPILSVPEFSYLLFLLNIAEHSMKIPVNNMKMETIVGILIFVSR